MCEDQTAEATLARASLGNPSLLVFMAQVQASNAAAKPLGHVSGLDPAEAALASAFAAECGVIERAVAASARWILTPAGWAYARAELATLRPLIAEVGHA